MPYILRKFKNGYKVCLVEDTTRCFSKKPIPKARAIKQMKAIGMNEFNKNKIENKSADDVCRGHSH